VVMPKELTNLTLEDLWRGVKWQSRIGAQYWTRSVSIPDQ